PGQREDPGDDGLRGYDRGNRGEQNHRVEQSAWNEAEKRRARVCRVVQDNGSLAEIVENKGRERHEVPGDADSPGPEVPHIGVEGLAPGHAEHYGAQQKEPAYPVV